MEVTNFTSVTVDRKTVTGTTFRYSVEVTKENNNVRRVVAQTIQRLTDQDPQYLGNANYDATNYIISLSPSLTPEERALILTDFEEIVADSVAV